MWDEEELLVTTKCLWADSKGTLLRIHTCASWPTRNVVATVRGKITQANITSVAYIQETGWVRRGCERVKRERYTGPCHRFALRTEAEGWQG